MTSVDFYRIRATWDSRPETDRECAARCAQMMRRLADVDPVFARWCKQAGSRKAANKPFCAMPPDIDELTRIFDKARKYLGHPKIESEPYRLDPGAGMRIAAWNGIDEPYSLAMSIFAGGFNNLAYPNKISIEMSEKRLNADQIWRGKSLRDVLLAIVEPWEANYAIVIGRRFSDTVPRDEGGYPFSPYAGWLTYLAHPASDRLVPPEGVISERFPDGAQLVTLCDEPCDPENPEHMVLAEAMHRAMRLVQQQANQR